MKKKEGKRSWRHFKITNPLMLVKKFQYAWEGLVAVFQYELSFRVEFIITLGFIIAGFVVGLGRLEWIAVAIGTGSIYTAEFLNTAIEKTVDHLHPDEHPEIKAVKDISAAGVMIANVTGLVIAALVFGPRLLG